MPKKPTYEELEKRLKGFEAEAAKRKQAEDAFLSEKKFTEGALNAQNDTFFVLDPDTGKAVRWNRAFSKMSGYTDDEIAGLKAPESYYDETDLKKAAAAIEQMFIEGKATVEISLITKAGNRIPTEYSISIIEDEKSGEKFIVSIGRDISARKEAEGSLRESEERFRNVYETAPLAFVVWNRDASVTDWNKAAEAVFGWTREEVVGLNIFDFLVPETDQEHVKDVFKGLLEGELPNHSINSNIRKDGQSITCEWNNSILHDGEGNIIGAISLGLDITDRIKTEKALRESEEQFRLLFETMASGFSLFEMVYDEMDNPVDCRYVNVNPAHHRISGLNPEEIIGKTVKELYNLKDEWIQKYGDVDETGVPLSFENYVEELDRWFRVVAYRPRPGIIAVISDNITEQKKTEAVLLESQRLLTNAIDNAAIGMILLRPDGYFYQVNQAFCELTGYSEKELLGMTFQDITYPEDYSIGAETIGELIAGESESATIQKRYIHKDGSVVHCFLTTILLRDGSGAPLYFFTQIQNITERIRAEEEKALLEAQLRQAQKMEAIGTLAGGIAHDFNNILSPIMAYSEMAMSDLPPDNSIKYMLEQIFHAGERARDLVRQILTFSQQKQQERAPLRLSTIVKETIKLLRASLPATIEIRPKIEAESGTILADPTEINQIVMNLSTNAAHAMRERGGVLDVRLNREEIDNPALSQFPDLRTGPYIRLMVKDTGHGMDADTLKRIFDPYFTTKGVGEGTGMGLAVVHGIVKSYDGDILVESEPGKGATFHVMLPSIGEVATSRARSRGDLPRGTERILLIDDEAAGVEAIQKMLERLGYTVSGKTSSPDALELFRNAPDAFDLVITDMTMPHMTGDQLAQEMLEIRPDIPIILCTGYSEAVSEKSAMAIGIKAFAMKPIAMEDIARIIRKALE